MANALGWATVILGGLALIGLVVSLVFTLLAGRNEKMNSAEIGCLLWGITLLLLVLTVGCGLMPGRLGG